MFKILAILAISLFVLIGCADVEASQPPKNRPVEVTQPLKDRPVVVTPTPVPELPPKPTSPQKAKKTWDVQIGSTEQLGKSLEWSPYGRTEEASGEWLVIEITLKNIGTSSNSLHRAAFRVKDAVGRVYNHYSDLTIAEVYGLYREGDLIDNKVISPGTTVSSYLVFDISTDAVGLQLEFTPDSFTKSETFELKNLSVAV